MKKSEIPNEYIEAANDLVKHYGENGKLTLGQFINNYLYDIEFSNWQYQFDEKSRQAYIDNKVFGFYAYMRNHKHLPKKFDRDLFIGLILSNVGEPLED